MANPRHVFSRQDCLFLGDNNAENRSTIESFIVEDGKLLLVLEKTFKQDNLLAVTNTISLTVHKWKLKHFM